MDKNSVRGELGASECVDEETSARWGKTVALLARLEAIGRDGAHAILKIDGGRADSALYTVVVSGGRLGEAFFRKDGMEVDVLLRDAIEFYFAHKAAT